MESNLVIANWSLREKVGQLFMCGFSTTMPDQHIEQLIQQYHIGGVIYFRRNVDHPEQLAECSAQLQQMSRTPLLISIDQEGGMAAHVEEGVNLMPGSMALGATRDVQGVYEAARITGMELRKLGINMNFAPCVDVNNNPANPVIGVRSYGESPELVADMGAAAIRGYQDAGIAATAKHFPGHGDTIADSHLELPTIPHDRERLWKVELVPFRAAIEAGVDAIMTAHVVFPAYVQDETPATLSQTILTDLLRNELTFDGVISTDCLEMNAIWKTVGVGEGAVRAVQAGADLILVSHRLELQIEGIEAVVRAVEEGLISESRIDESVNRLLRLKAKRGLISRDSGAGRAAEGSEQIEVETMLSNASETARRLSEQSITMVKDEQNAIPIPENAKIYAVWPELRVGTVVGAIAPQEVTLGKALGELFVDVVEQRIGIEPTEEEIQTVLNDSKDCTHLVIGTYNAGFSQGQQRLIQRLLERDSMGARLIVVALRNPFDLNAFPEVPCFVACYENKPIAMRSLSQVLSGKRTAVGKLPVTVGQYPIGWGLPASSQIKG